MHEALSEPIQLEAQLDVLVSEAISTSAIEGELLTRDSVRQSLKRHLGLSRANNHRDRNAEGVANLLIASRAPLNKQLDETILFSWHKEVLGDGMRLIGRDLVVGAWRNEPMEIVSGNIGHEKVHYAAPPADIVPQEISVFLSWFNKSNPLTDGVKMNGPTRAALAHLWFEVIHPFDDGNGRVGRAIADLCLAQDKNRPALLNLSHVLLKHRREYYDQLEAASKTLDITSWVNWFYERVIEGSS